MLDVVISGLSAEADVVNNDLEVEEGDALQHHKQILEVYGFLLQWTIAAIETKAAEKPASTTAARGKGGKGAKAKTAGKDGWDSAAAVQNALDVMSKVLKLRLVRVFTTTSDRDTFVNLFTRAVYLVLESEARVKSTPMRMHAFKVLCIAVKHHGHAYGMLLEHIIRRNETDQTQAHKHPSSKAWLTLNTFPSPWRSSCRFSLTNMTIRSCQRRF